MTLLQISEAKEILSIESVSVLGLLLLIIAGLLWYINKLLKKSEQRDTEIAEIIKEKDEKIMSFIEKFYIMSTKIYSVLKKTEDV